MLAKKPFKGGNLDDFVAAGEAERKYGPQRYAAVSEDLRSLVVDKTASKEQQEYSKRIYEALKKQLINDHLFLSFMGSAIMWTFFDLTAVKSYALGAALGLLYLVLQQRYVDSFGASSIEDVKGGPPPLVAPILLVLAVAKNPGQLAFLPTFAGFATERLTFVLQALKPDDFGLPPEDVAEATAD
jgi:hypothetical protein